MPLSCDVIFSGAPHDPSPFARLGRWKCSIKGGSILYCAAQPQFQDKKRSGSGRCDGRPDLQAELAHTVGGPAVEDTRGARPVAR